MNPFGHSKMGASVSTAVTNATQNSVQQIISSDDKRFIDVNKNTIKNFISSHDGKIIIDDMVNSIKSTTNFTARIVVALSESMQSSTAQMVAQNVLAQLKDLNLFQAGASVADIAAAINVTLDTFRDTTTTCASLAMNNVGLNAVAKGDVELKNVHNSIDSDTIARCSTESAINNTLKSEQVQDIQQRVQSTVTGISAAWFLVGLLILIFAVGLPIALPLMVGGELVKKLLPTIILTGSGVGLLAYYNFQHATIVSIDGPEVFDVVNNKKLIEITPVSDLQDVMEQIQRNSDRFTSFRVDNSILYGIPSRISLTAESVMASYIQLPIIASISEDGKYIYLNYLHDSAYTFAYIIIPENVYVKAVGVSAYVPNEDTRPLNFDNDQCVVSLYEDHLRLFYWKKSLNQWHQGPYAKTSLTRPKDENDPNRAKYNKTSSTNDVLYQVEQSKLNNKLKNKLSKPDGSKLRRYYFIERMNWPQYAGSSLLVMGLVGLMFTLYKQNKYKDDEKNV
ncbi:hypothetical protein [Trichoplusia ni ascovirus 2c]|uniref:hypothetical protein n=1 Tax=Trichoplusia ni ascovirus 2c TaxID=328615 RepID=UPI0000E44271|nr:hypothetical protein TNAV2c_gp157 [Trichoplusia ni ascovirus 2c]ABF70672.1 hypothetical protein [Trichoplusia ni ascovirus 2c]